MPEFCGDDETVARQRQILARSADGALAPDFASGGRTHIYVEPSEATWPAALAIAREDGLLTLALHSRTEVAAMVAERFGETWTPHYWDALTGSAGAVVAASGKVVTDTPLPQGWTVSSVRSLDAAAVEAFQTLNAACGVAPNPAYMLRGEGCPSLTTLIHDAAGQLVAGAWAGMFFDPVSRLGDVVFAGLVSVAGAARGRGLGKLVNARLLIDSHAALGWGRATEFVAADNPASRHMVEACGLAHHDALVTAIVTRGDRRMTR